MPTKVDIDQIGWGEVQTGTIASGANLGLDSNDNIVKASVSGGGGGGGTDTFVFVERGQHTSNLIYNKRYYKNSIGGYVWSLHKSKSGYTSSHDAGDIFRYASLAVLPANADLKAYHLVGRKDGGGTNTATLKIWKMDAPSTSTGSSADAEDTVKTLTEIASIEIDVNNDKLFNFSGTLSSSNSYSAGDVVYVTIESTGDTSSDNVNSDHYWTLSLKFQST